jgi:hypothetical protein
VFGVCFAFSTFHMVLGRSVKSVRASCLSIFHALDRFQAGSPSWTVTDVDGISASLVWTSLSQPRDVDICRLPARTRKKFLAFLCVPRLSTITPRAQDLKNLVAATRRFSWLHSARSSSRIQVSPRTIEQGIVDSLLIAYYTLYSLTRNRHRQRTLRDECP